MMWYLLLGIVLFLFLILFIPVSFSGQGCLADTLTGEAKIAWAGGLIGTTIFFKAQEKPNFILNLGGWDKRIKVSEQKAKVGSKTPGTNKTSAKPKRTRKFSFNQFKSILDKQVLIEIVHFINRVWYSLKVRLNLEGEYGTDDPAITGIIAAVIASLNGNSNRLRLAPNFENVVLSLEGEIQCRLVPAAMIKNFGGLMVKAPIRRIWWNMLIKK